MTKNLKLVKITGYFLQKDMEFYGKYWVEKAGHKTIFAKLI